MRVSVISSISMLLLRTGKLKEALSRCCKFSPNLLREMTKVRTSGHAPAVVFQVEE